MAVRIRKNGDIVCAAVTKPEPKDIYLNDDVHGILSSDLVVMSVCKFKNGVDYWEFHAPMTISERIKKEKKVKKIVMKDELYGIEFKSIPKWFLDNIKAPEKTKKRLIIVQRGKNIGRSWFEKYWKSNTNI